MTTKQKKKTRIFLLLLNLNLLIGLMNILYKYLIGRVNNIQGRSLCRIQQNCTYDFEIL